MFTQPTNISFTLPGWLEEYARGYRATTSLPEQMAFVVGASRKNVLEKSGGPFAAAIFNSDNGELISLGVNRVTTQGISILHAEMVAVVIAQRKLGHYDLGHDPATGYSLVTSTEPCAMCYGAIPWSGVRRVVTAARDSDARAVGFDEGPKPADWIAGLEKRGIGVVTGIEEEKAREVLRLYRQMHGKIYNARGRDNVNP